MCVCQEVVDEISHSIASNLYALEKQGAACLFYQDRTLPLAGFGKNELKSGGRLDGAQLYILADPVQEQIFDMAYVFRRNVVHRGFNNTFALEDIIPDSLYNDTDRIVLRPSPYNYGRYATVIAMVFRGTVAETMITLLVLCDYRNTTPTCKLFDRDKHSHQAAMLFNNTYRNDSMFWVDLEFPAPDVLGLTNFVEMTAGDEVLRITVTLEETPVKNLEGPVEVYSLTFGIGSHQPQCRDDKDVKALSDSLKLLHP